MIFGWLSLALIGYGLAAFSGVIDKIIVNKGKVDPVVFSFWVALSSIPTAALLLVGLLPFGFAETFKFESPTFEVFIQIIIAGFLFQLSLFIQYIALQKGEATRVFSSMGAIAPIATLIVAFIVLGERLASTDYIAFSVLVVGTYILAKKIKTTHKSKLRGWFPYALLSASILGIQTVIIKEVYTVHHFISAYALISVGNMIYCAFLLSVSNKARAELAGLFRTKPVKSKSKNKKKKTPVGLIILNVLIGGLAVILINVAIKLGSPTLVNALRGVQYAGLFIIAIFLAGKYPKLLDEDLTKKSLAYKISGIILVSIGVMILASSL